MNRYGVFEHRFNRSVVSLRKDRQEAITAWRFFTALERLKKTQYPSYEMLKYTVLNLRAEEKRQEELQEYPSDSDASTLPTNSEKHSMPHPKRPRPSSGKA